MKTKKSLVVFLSCTCLAIFSGCHLVQNQQDVDTDGEFAVATGNGLDVTVSQGDTLIINMQTQSGTGYGWELIYSDSSLVLLEGPAIESSDNIPGLPGAVEYTMFKFTVNGPGRLELNYIRPWEKEVAPEIIYHIDVKVE